MITPKCQKRWKFKVFFYPPLISLYSPCLRLRPLHIIPGPRSPWDPPGIVARFQNRNGEVPQRCPGGAPAPESPPKNPREHFYVCSLMVFFVRSCEWGQRRGAHSHGQSYGRSMEDLYRGNVGNIGFSTVLFSNGKLFIQNH